MNREPQTNKGDAMKATNRGINIDTNHCLSKCDAAKAIANQLGVWRSLTATLSDNCDGSQIYIVDFLPARWDGRHSLATQQAIYGGAVLRAVTEAHYQGTAMTDPRYAARWARVEVALATDPIISH